VEWSAIVSCTSIGCRLAMPHESLAPLCFVGCRIEMREAARPAPPPEPPASADQVAAQDSMFDVLPPRATP
jgi:hypothetical protein